MGLSFIVFNFCEIVGTVAFAISGAMIAIKARMDIFGVIFIGIITALGGGITRDLLIGNTPPIMFTTPKYALIAIVTSLVVFVIASILKDIYLKNEKIIENINNIFDAFGL